MTTTTEAPTATTRPTIVLAVLFAGAFVMGCAEMLVVGMIDLIAADLEISVPMTGLLVTANALGLAIGGPLLTFLVTRFDRRHVLITATAVFVLANLMPALGAGYPVFVGARVVIGVGLFGMATGPSIQHRVVSLAGPGAPLAASLPASAVNAGIAFGAFAGGLAIDGGGVRLAVVAGIAIAVIAIAAAWATSALKPAVAASVAEAAAAASATEAPTR